MTLSPADSPANQSALQEPDSRNQILDGYGPSSSESFAWYDPDMLSWKTSQVSLLPDLETLPMTWPESGMASNGRMYRRVPWGHHIHEAGCFLWPTPTASTAGKNARSLYLTIIGELQMTLDRAAFIKAAICSETAHGLDVNPSLSEWLMGFPEGWTDLEDSETP